MASIRGVTFFSQSTSAGLAMSASAVSTGDYAIAIGGHDGNNPNTITASGSYWTAVVTGSMTGFPHAAFAYYTIITGSTPVPYEFTASAGANGFVGTLVIVDPAGATVNYVTSSVSGTTAAGNGSASFQMPGAAGTSVLIGAWVADDLVASGLDPVGMAFQGQVDSTGMSMRTYTQLDVGAGTIDKLHAWATETERYAIGILLSFQDGGTPTVNRILISPSGNSRMHIDGSPLTGPRIRINL